MQDGRRTAESESSSRASRDPRHDVLFTPLRIGPKETRNRFYQVPQCGPGGTVTPWTQAAHREVKAEGGWGVVCVEETVISGDSDQVPLYMGTLLDDEDVARYALTCDAVHRHGSLAGVELSHGGLRCWNRNSRLTSIAPSAMALGGAVHGSPPVTMARAMDEDDIRRLKGDWVRAARRAIHAGFDVIYVYGSAGYLPAQFLSPRTNLRTDKYGGSFENRARFLMETLTAVREEIDGEAALAVRISVDRSNEPPYAIDISQLARFMTLADDLVDLWDVNDNGVDPAFTYGGIDSTPSRFYEEGYLVKPTAPLRDSTSKPIVGVARLTDPNLMAQIISSGTWDLIGAARPSIADPFLPRKIEEGTYDEIRECTGSNLCIMSVRHNGNAVCVQNPTAFEEHRRGWHPERFERATNADNDVLVVGAGPAGMECAIVLAKRGFERIHLVDSTDEIGGHLRWTTQLPGQGSMARLINWRRIQIDKLSAIEVITGRTLTADEVRTYGAELVVVATGARWSTEGLDPWTARPIPGLQADVPYILTPEQLMVEKKPLPGDRVVIYDSEGYYCGAGIAEQLAVQGCKVTIATPMGSLAPVLKDTKETFLLGKRIHELGIEVVTNMTAVGANSEGLQMSGYLGDKHEIKADAVVSITSRVVNDTLYQQLAADAEALRDEGIVGMYRAGDCHAPRLVTEAIFDGHRLAREIDSEDPAVPRPYLRELAKVERVSA